MPRGGARKKYELWRTDIFTRARISRDGAIVRWGFSFRVVSDLAEGLVSGATMPQTSGLKA